MRLLRASLFSICLAAASAGGTLVPRDAHASVSIAVGFDALVKDADAGVAIVTPTESKSVWEGGRIITYTKVKVDQAVAGELSTGQEGWVRTMGGVVGKIGQLVDGEPVLSPNKQSLLFLRKFTTSGTYEVSARAQGQFPVITDETSKARKLVRSSNVGVLFPPKGVKPTEVQAGAVGPQAQTQAPEGTEKIRLASEVIHDRAVDDAVKEIAAAWKKAHPTPTK